MRRFAIGVVVGVVFGSAVSASAGTAAYRYLNRGDTAVATGGETVCRAAPRAGSRLGFVCTVGGDYRARYGVVINEREAAITQYTSFNRYRLLVRKAQSPLR